MVCVYNEMVIKASERDFRSDFGVCRRIGMPAERVNLLEGTAYNESNMGKNREEHRCS